MSILSSKPAIASGGVSLERSPHRGDPEMSKRFASLDDKSSLFAAREHDRFVYNHKYPMKEDAFQKILE